MNANALYTDSWCYRNLRLRVAMSLSFSFLNRNAQFALFKNVILNFFNLQKIHKKSCKKISTMISASRRRNLRDRVLKYNQHEYQFD